MLRGIKGILFDLDETLHSREAAFRAWIEDEAEAARVSNLLDRTMIGELDCRGRGDKTVLLKHLDDVFGWGMPTGARLARFRMGLSGHLQLAPGALKMLTRVGLRYRLGLVSNGSSETQRMKLARLGLEGLFEPVVISGEVGIKKPDARIFERAMQAWRLRPEQVLFVGDDPVSDIAGAKSVGMQTLQVGQNGDVMSVTELEDLLEAGER